MNHRTTFILIFLLGFLFYHPATASENTYLPKRHALQELISRLSYSEGHHFSAVPMGVGPQVARFYDLLGYRPAWLTPDGLLPNGRILLKTLANVTRSRPFPSDKLPSFTETAWIDSAQQADTLLNQGVDPFIQLDVILTTGMIRYANHLYKGSIMPEQLYGSWLAQRRPVTRDVACELAQSVISDCFSQYIESLHPQSAAYQRLRSALGRYEEIRRRGGWIPIDAGPTLRKGDRGLRVAMLKYRLKMTGDGFDGEPIQDDRFDDPAVKAVQQFQRRHGLKPDGLVGKETLAELNIPVDHRIRQLQLNMERWHWFPDSFGDRYIIVNIPAFELTVVDAGRTAKRIRVIVGKKDRQTPVMSDEMTYVAFNPYWNIPHNIARKDILPKIQQDLTYLTNHGIRVFNSWDRQAQEIDPTSIDWAGLSAGHFPYRLRQDPSRRNALGQIKFIFPNSHSIYIHDTPGKTLFHQQQRTFSSGCIRIEKPITLAAQLLGEQGWGRNRLEALTASEKPKSVILSTPIPVHLVYFTAWANEKSTVHFRKDIYGRDESLLHALQNQASDRAADNESSTINNLIAYFMKDDRQNDKPPGDEQGKEKTLPKQATQNDSELWQTGSGYGNGIPQGDSWETAHRPIT